MKNLKFAWSVSKSVDPSDTALPSDNQRIKDDGGIAQQDIGILHRSSSTAIARWIKSILRPSL